MSKFDSPLRRQSAIRSASIQVPIVPNDDEAERQAARINESLSESPHSLEDNENLKDCLKLYTDNKLNKDNAWKVGLIDQFSAFVARHHRFLNNFQIVGSTLEASSRVYALRVDSLHTDVLRMSTQLTRHNFEDKANDEPYDVNEIGNDSLEKQKGQKKKRLRKLVSTVTKSKESINAVLATVPFTDPLFAKLNLFVGSISCPNRLLQNILLTNDSEQLLTMNVLHWDALLINELTEMLGAFDIIDQTHNLDIPINELLRPRYSGYVILDSPAEEDVQEEDSCSNSLNESEMNMAFDINAEVEPITDPQHFLHPFESDEIGDLSTDDHFAINACKGLVRPPDLVEDLRPLDADSVNEYSYRALDNINRFWAGPSHWKFKRHPLSIQSNLGYACPYLVGSHTEKIAKKKYLRNKVEPIDFDEIDEKLFVSIQKMETKNNKTIKKWDARKLKLPSNLRIDQQMFNFLFFAPGISIRNLESTNQLNIDLNLYNYDNPSDKGYCSNVHDEDTDTDRTFDDQEIPCSSNNEPLNSEISMHFPNAPEKVVKIIIPFSKKPKFIDMKQLKQSCMNIIENERSKTICTVPSTIDDKCNDKLCSGAAKFSTIYSELPQNLTKQLSDSLSPGVAFYSILHLANEYQLRLIQDFDYKDFDIRKLDM